MTRVVALTDGWNVFLRVKCVKKRVNSSSSKRLVDSIDGFGKWKYDAIAVIIDVVSSFEFVGLGIACKTESNDMGSLDEALISYKTASSSKIPTFEMVVVTVKERGVQDAC